MLQPLKVALPADDEETAPEFHHHPSATLPAWTQNGVALRLIAGDAFGRRAPVKTFSPMFYADAQFEAGARLRLDAAHDERAVLVLHGRVDVAGEAIAAGEMAVLTAGEDVELAAGEPARLVLFGGAALGHRHLWWNFVSSSRERIERAKQDWRDQRFGALPNETEFIPLPDW